MDRDVEELAEVEAKLVNILPLFFCFLVHQSQSQFLLLFSCDPYFIFIQILIQKGWKALVWFISVHLDPEIYPNPKEFNPYRWNISREASSLPILS